MNILDFQTLNVDSQIFKFPIFQRELTVDSFIPYIISFLLCESK